ncbi:velvet factor-domain-containing protein [Polychytrium aggregatum]|uniref:velvet factor-domain-containing protein n=1 Tax=Polychytrium aggregatum TaxID=110093 RepID=UPI0022FF1B88|nr:velvet factor-domain-containing protein [Polychytrium aggregatum]KAI9208744.1 velvet factor-domain-containing protein [Polychytrium aggregatum]
MHPSDVTYKLVISQQPIRARMCGFSDTKDRRLIDPPPVIQLLVVDREGNTIDVSPEHYPLLVCYVSLYSAQGSEDRSVVIHPRAKTKGLQASHDLYPFSSSSQFCQTLVGTLVTSCAVLYDHSGKEGMFFVFNDISVRTQGTYRLKFNLINVTRRDSTTGFEASIVSDVFESFPPKTFPGMTDSTELSRCFARQGVAIHIRKDAALGGHSSEESSERTSPPERSVPKRYHPYAIQPKLLAQPSSQPPQQQQSYRDFHNSTASMHSLSPAGLLLPTPGTTPGFRASPVPSSSFPGELPSRGTSPPPPSRPPYSQSFPPGPSPLPPGSFRHLPPPPPRPLYASEGQRSFSGSRSLQSNSPSSPRSPDQGQQRSLTSAYSSPNQRSNR